MYVQTYDCVLCDPESSFKAAALAAASSAILCSCNSLALSVLINSCNVRRSNESKRFICTIRATLSQLSNINLPRTSRVYK